MFSRTHDWLSPFTAPVSRPVRDPLLLLQADRLHAILPLLCLTIAANAVAMGLAVLGDLPSWQQAAPPLIIVGTCLAILAKSRLGLRATGPNAAYHQLRNASFVAAGLGLVAGLWCVNAFNETEKYYCMVAPVFIGIAALVSATCLLSVPRAAIIAMVMTVAPIIVKMALYDNLGVRAMAAMMIIVVVMQGGVVLAKFRETVSMLTLQHELNRVAESDSLTGLDNRLAFMRKLDAQLVAGVPVMLALADLDGFKKANDSFGHQAGDAILIEVGRRMRQMGQSAISVARLGGDEFALLFPAPRGLAQAEAEIAAIRATIPLPFCHGTTILSVGASFGCATSDGGQASGTDLLALADQRLYADKARQERVDSAPQFSNNAAIAAPAA